MEEKEDCNRDRTALTGKLHAVVNKGLVLNSATAIARVIPHRNVPILVIVVYNGTAGLIIVILKK